MFPGVETVEREGDTHPELLLEMQPKSVRATPRAAQGGACSRRFPASDACRRVAKERFSPLSPASDSSPCTGGHARLCARAPRRFWRILHRLRGCARLLVPSFLSNPNAARRALRPPRRLSSYPPSPGHLAPGFAAAVAGAGGAAPAPTPTFPPPAGAPPAAAPAPAVTAARRSFISMNREKYSVARALRCGGGRAEADAGWASAGGCAAVVPSGTEEGGSGERRAAARLFCHSAACGKSRPRRASSSPSAASSEDTTLPKFRSPS